MSHILIYSLVYPPHILILTLTTLTNDRYRDSMSALESDDHAKSIEALDRKWKQELDKSDSEHSKKVNELKVRWEEQLEAYKHSASLANSEWGSIEGELLQERKGFLDSMVKHRELRDNHEVG